MHVCLFVCLSFLSSLECRLLDGADFLAKVLEVLSPPNRAIGTSVIREMKIDKKLKGVRVNLECIEYS